MAVALSHEGEGARCRGDGTATRGPVWGETGIRGEGDMAAHKQQGDIKVLEEIFFPVSFSLLLIVNQI
ncbi:hypothetical protein DPMN_090708 [Dreissena polymorpha]|uniref:Uncharacterized protein n=1 Tax=Dreissena polymorpha TaxID=45954 RepID=A0A9D4KY87_DREPO|nr:hypothetical protein DPMN_090708 [Dreissena polymorpha]